MKKDSIVDYCGYILVKLLGPFIRGLPLNVALFFGARVGELLFYFAFKQKALVYANIKTAFKDELLPAQINQLVKKFYRNFGQSLVEIFFIPLINKKYIQKYIRIEGLEYIQEGFKRGKGVIFLGVHSGSWELSNIICANLGFPFNLFIRNQRHPRLNNFLNVYRRQKGCQIIQRHNHLPQLIQALKSNQVVGITLDQGGKTGTLVKFLGKEASMATGAIRLALKYDATIIPGFYTRINGPYIKVMLEPPFQIKKSGDFAKDVQDNLQGLTQVFEKYILKYPQEYLWSYKIWKYGRQKHILILSDGKTGHTRQSQAVANIMENHLKEKGMYPQTSILEIKFKNRLAKNALNISSGLAGKYHCQGCLWCLKTFLKEESYNAIISTKPDVVISSGSSMAPLNFVVSRENLAKSIVIMRPGILSTKRFDLVIMPRHDNPAKRKNVVVTSGALNLIDENYLKEQSAKLLQLTTYNLQLTTPKIGLLIGGNTKSFLLSKETILEVIQQLKSAAEKLDTDILVTTSRRTSKDIENLVKAEFKDYPRCKLLVIANEKNLTFALGGILALSQFIIISPESISMISEAVKSKKYVLVFNALGLNRKHLRFLNYFAQNKYIYIANPADLSKTIENLWSDRPSIPALNDNFLIQEAIKRIL
jgi:KDO2-lipid IV(A) lauroyltransferase